MITIVIKGKDETAAAAQSAASNIKQIGDAAETQSNRIQNFFSGAATIVAGAGAVMAGAMVGVGMAGLSLNNSMEQASAKIQAFTKDSAQTAAILEMVRERAAKTPFAFTEMAEATASLLPAAKASGAELENLIALAEILAASNPAEGLEGAAYALKEALSGDFTSIIERFNLPRQYINQLKEEGVPNLEIVSQALQSLGLDADLVTGLAQTLEGRWSSFTDTLQNLAATITKPIFDTLSSGLADVQSLFDANEETIQQFANLLATNLASAISSVASVVQTFVQAWNDAGASTDDVVARIGAAIDNIVGTDGTFQAWATAIQASIVNAFTVAKDVVDTVMPAILAVVQAVLPVVQAFWEENGTSIMATVQETWNTIVDIITVVSQIISQVLSVIAGFINAHGEEIKAYITAAWNVISSVIKTALDLVSGIVRVVLQLLQGDFAGAWNTIVSTAETFKNNLVRIFQSLVGLLSNAINLAIAAVMSAWSAFARGADSFGSEMISGIVRGIGRGVGALRAAITSAAQAALDAARRTLGISSPSRVFAEQVGLPIAQGMAVGMVRAAPVLASAGMTMAGSALYGAQQNITYNVDARNSTMTAAQWQETIKRVQDVAARDAEIRRAFL